MKKVSIIMLAILFLTGCMSVPEPDSNNRILTLGQINFKGTNYNNANGLTLNGEHEGNIILTIKNINTRKEFELETYYDGLFYSVDIPKGNYRIIKMLLTVSDGSGSMYTWTTPNGSKRFVINDNSVNNLGKINWRSDNNVSSNFTFDFGYKEVNELFQNKFKNSSWNNQNWKRTKIKN